MINIETMKKTILFATVILSSLFLTACGPNDYKKSTSDNSPEEIGEELAEKIIGRGEASVDIDFEAEEGGEGISWPENIPSKYPEFSGGKIEIVMGDFDTNDGMMLQLIEIGEGEIEKYVSELEESGWKIERIEEEGILLQVDGVKENLKFSFDINPVGPGTAFLNLAKN